MLATRKEQQNLQEVRKFLLDTLGKPKSFTELMDQFDELEKINSLIAHQLRQSFRVIQGGK
jgi:CRISPR/Cas system endoribonuclease Cas6 (RAMP superfamily)